MAISTNIFIKSLTRFAMENIALSTVIYIWVDTNTDMDCWTATNHVLTVFEKQHMPSEICLEEHFTEIGNIVKSLFRHNVWLLDGKNKVLGKSTHSDNDGKQVLVIHVLTNDIAISISDLSKVVTISVKAKRDYKINRRY